MSLNDDILKRLQNGLMTANSANEPLLNSALRLLAKWRSVLIQNTFLQHTGATVQSGLFKDLKLLEKTAEGCYVAKLLGCYEQPLLSALKQFLNKDK